MGKLSRTKGARGEVEVVKLAKACGLEAQRTAALQAGRHPGVKDVLLLDFPRIHVEVKRDEHKSVDAMVRQAESQSITSEVPVVAWRRNKRAWRADVPLDHYLELLKCQSQT